MFKRNLMNHFVYIIVVVSFIVKLILIFRYKNSLTLSSDDLNYLKSALVLIKRGTFIFHNYNEPTVFIMPLYPLFLAITFRLFGYGLAGLQAVRIIQAVISSVTLVMAYQIGKYYFNKKTGLIAAALMAFYFPNIVTTGYMLTETMFSALLCTLLYLSLKYSDDPSYIKFAILGIIWTLATLCRPTIALYPFLLFFYILTHVKMDIIRAIKYGIVMAAAFFIIMFPWWIRNYQEYGKFIPLAASSGNPMLQGTYIDYTQTPENMIYYKLGKNAFETNRIEVDIAKQRIFTEIKENFWRYVKWFTLGKTFYLWKTIFYWKIFWHISPNVVLAYHYVVLAGFLGIFTLLIKNALRYILPVSIIIYFNIVHCVYMAFDRYALPLLPILSVFSAYFLYSVYSICRYGTARLERGS